MFSSHLYFLLHFWIQLPLPGSLIARMRAHSALWVLLGTALLDRLWLRRLPPRTRLWFLALWTFSPCLVLYARMARSYTMQLALACLALAAARRFSCMCTTYPAARSCWRSTECSP